MARGLGTTFGVALTTLALHLAGPSDGPRLAFAVLMLAAVVLAVSSARLSRQGS